MARTRDITTTRLESKKNRMVVNNREHTRTTLAQQQVTTATGQKFKKNLQREQYSIVAQFLASNDEPGLEIVYSEQKGRDVCAMRPFDEGDFVVAYRGDLITFCEAKKREIGYMNDSNAGSYMFYFRYNSKKYW